MEDACFTSSEVKNIDAEDASTSNTEWRWVVAQNITRHKTSSQDLNLKTKKTRGTPPPPSHLPQLRCPSIQLDNRYAHFILEAFEHCKHADQKYSFYKSSPKSAPLSAINPSPLQSYLPNLQFTTGLHLTCTASSAHAPLDAFFFLHTLVRSLRKTKKNIVPHEWSNICTILEAVLTTRLLTALTTLATPVYICIYL